ncbi:MAG TPA: iron-containing alcohol dehydrogenase [Candidatus Dormibacteraeota bacterium]|nr:iron-containing alcohol dehydrogenase [Candidatus Dormibacteraeota bacterium]
MPTSVFTYSNPRVIHWGPGSIDQLSAELQRLEASRVALVTTRSLVDGATKRVGFEPAVTAVIGQHAPMAQVRAATEDVGLAGAKAIVSFGGGSVIDAAKIISVQLAGHDGRALPHIAIPTTLSVAELAAGAGFTNEAGDKAGMRDPRLMVETVIYDAELTLSTPMQLWLSTGIRALDHAVEGFLADGEHPFSDVMALEAIRRLFDSLPRAKASPDSVDVRTENELAAWFSFTLPGASASGLSHTMGKQIGARHGIPHGVTSCLLLPHVMRYLAAKMPDRFAQLPTPDEVEELIASLDLPQHITEFDVGQAAMRRAADELAGKYAAADLLGIYLAAL